MFKNYLITTLRSLARQKLFSIVNIGGLALGLGSCLLIIALVLQEFRYDTFLPGNEDIYRVEMTANMPGQQPRDTGLSPGGLQQSIREGQAGIAAVTRFDSNNAQIKVGDNQSEERIVFVDPEFFDVLPFPVMFGDTETALQGGSGMVLTEAVALKLFGRADVIGESVLVQNENDYQVTAVIRDLPARTAFNFTAIAPIADRTHGPQFQSWGAISASTYLRLEPGTPASDMNARFPKIIDDNFPARMAEALQMEGSEFFQFRLLPIADVHLYGAISNGGKPPGDITSLLVFAAIAGLILLIAAFNFVNLSTAKAVRRAHEVAIRKVVGASRGQLMTQFLGESVLIVIIALMLGGAMAWWASDIFASLLPGAISLNIFGDSILLPALIGLIAVVGIGAGFYPALLLSSFRPSQIIHGDMPVGTSKSFFRSLFVVLQFAISIGMITATLVIQSQISYLQNLDTGFEQNGLAVLTGATSRNGVNDAAALVTELRRLPSVIDVTRSNRVPADGNRMIGMVRPIDSEDRIQVDMFNVDFNYFDVIGVEPVAGRLFDADRTGDAVFIPEFDEPQSEASVVINLAAMAQLGFVDPEEAIGTRLSNGPGSGLVVIGVIPDMTIISPLVEVPPAIFTVDLSNVGTIMFRYVPGDEAALQQQAEAIWEQFAPGVPMNLLYMDEMISSAFDSDRNRGELLAIFAGLAIIVSCLGLFGSASYSTERRTREISIRKIFGGTEADIIRQILMQFSKPVLIANFLAWPVAFYFMSGWLDGFTYRVPLTLTPFMLAAALALVIAWLTVSSQAWLVARTKPAAALRHE